MKYQNCILINFVADAQTDEPKAICPFNFGINIDKKYVYVSKP